MAFTTPDTFLNLLEKLKNRSGGRVTAFYFGSTYTGVFSEEGYYATPIRETPSLIYAGVVMRSTEMVADIAKLLDGQVDYIFVDAEKKIDSLAYGKSGDYDLEQSVKTAFHRSKVLTYKGNDLAAQAFDDLMGTLIQNFSGLNFAIIGVGNVGLKIAIKLMERGSNVSLYRRNGAILLSMASSLSMMRPGCLVARARMASSVKDACVDAHCIVACASSQSLITKDDLGLGDGSRPRSPLLIDIGKGCFVDELVNSPEHQIHRLDISIIQSHYFSALINTSQFYAQPLGKKTLNNGQIVIVSQGLLAGYGEFVIDNIVSPKKILGIANGKGSFIEDTKPFDEALKYLVNIEKMIVNF